MLCQRANITSHTYIDDMFTVVTTGTVDILGNTDITLEVLPVTDTVVSTGLIVLDGNTLVKYTVLLLVTLYVILDDKVDEGKITDDVSKLGWRVLVWLMNKVLLMISDDVELTELAEAVSMTNVEDTGDEVSTKLLDEYNVEFGKTETVLSTKCVELIIVEFSGVDALDVI